MTETLVVNPDTEFIRDVLGNGGKDLKKCYQCATCTSVCALSTEDIPFPRKQMIEAQWGLKDRLLGDPAIWLCHNCGDCTVCCPRDVKPGAVMGALRAQAIKNYAFPRFMGQLTSQPRYLPLLLAVPVLIFAAIAAWAPKEPPTAELEFGSVFGDAALEGLFWVVALLAILVYAVGIARMVNALRRAGHDGKILPALIPASLEIVSHKRFAECGAEKSRYWGHLLTLFGFLGLFVVGGIVGIGVLSGLIHPPLSILNPLKLFANICTVVIAMGLIIMLAERMGSREGRGPNTYFDWFFLLTLAGIVLTGMLSEILRLGESKTMYPVYFVHLVLIFSLFLYGPYSKFSHFIYRTIAMAATWEERAQAVTKVMTAKEAFA